MCLVTFVSFMPQKTDCKDDVGQGMRLANIALAENWLTKAEYLWKH